MKEEMKRHVGTIFCDVETWIIWILTSRSLKPVLSLTMNEKFALCMAMNPQLSQLKLRRQLHYITC